MKQDMRRPRARARIPAKTFLCAILSPYECHDGRSSRQLRSSRYRIPYVESGLSALSDERGQARGGGGSGIAECDAGWFTFNTAMRDATPGSWVCAPRTTVKALETHPLDITQPAGTLLPSHGACAGNFELLEVAPIEPAPMPAIGLVHTGSFAPTIRLVEKKMARRNPKRRVCTVWN